MTQNPKPQRLTPCDRHPNLPTTTGLCGPCLHERLSLLTPSTTAPPPPELRRCKTFSANNRAAAVFEPSRRSCDVGGSGGDSLSNLFHLDNDGNGGDVIKVESRNLGLTCTVPEAEDEEEDDDDEESVPEGKVEVASVRVSNLGIGNGNVCENDFEDGKTMKEFIDLELGKPNASANNRKDFKDIAGSFLGAASIFSKKLRKWRKKNENSALVNDNRNGNGVSLGEMRIEDLRGRRLSYTQSEGRRSCDTEDPRGSSLVLGRASIDCGAFGRKSCDEDPRFSIDIGRASVDSKTDLVDAPRASWDGYLLGGGRRGLSHRGNTPVVSVIENAMATVYGFDDRVLGEGKVKKDNGDDKDSSLRRRKGFDRCSSVRSSMPECDEVKDLSNAKVSPAAIGIFNGTKLLITEKELNEWRLNSLKDDSSESFETASKDLGSASSSSVGKDEKKCRQWTKLWNFWGSLHRRKGDKFGNNDELQEKPRNGKRDALVRSYSTSSSRGSSSVLGSSSGTTNNADSRAIVKRRPEDGVLERNRSARYSPNQIDNGMLRFYLTPLRSYRRNRLGKSRLKKSHSLARSVLKLY